MCIVIDANLAAAAFQEPILEEYRPIFDWLNNGGRLVFGGKLTKELLRIGHVSRRLRALNQAGIALQCTADEIALEEALLSESSLITSNDRHILALARLSGARILCTDDQALQADFKNLEIVPRPKGKIYKCAQHSHLLKHTNQCIGRIRH